MTLTASLIAGFPAFPTTVKLSPRRQSMLAVTKFLSIKIVGLLLITSIVANLILAFCLIDVSVSLDHSRSQQAMLKDRSIESLALIRDMVLKFSKEDLNGFIAELESKGWIVKTTSSVIEVGDIVLTLDGEKITTVTYLD
jgi:hypothetical protein